MASGLRITDLRVAVVRGAPMPCPLIRIDTNQEGLYGLGEVRDGASKTYALMLKSRLVGEDPRNVDKLFRKIKQFGFHARQAGGVCAVEMALWDIVGKYYGVPVWQLLGGTFRDAIRIYADTDLDADPSVTGRRLKERADQGFTFLKMDFMRASRKLGTFFTIYGDDRLPPGMNMLDVLKTQHMFTGIELSDKQIGRAVDYVAEVRRVLGDEIPLAADHFGHIGINSCIRLGKALEPYQLAWLEDMVPWKYTEMLKQITQAIDIPTLTGEDIYLKEEFIKLIDA